MSRNEPTRDGEGGNLPTNPTKIAAPHQSCWNGFSNLRQDRDPQSLGLKGTVVQDQT